MVWNSPDILTRYFFQSHVDVLVRRGHVTPSDFIEVTADEDTTQLYSLSSVTSIGIPCR